MEQKMRSDGSCEIVAGQAFKQVTNRKSREWLFDAKILNTF